MIKERIQIENMVEIEIMISQMNIKEKIDREKSKKINLRIVPPHITIIQKKVFKLLY